MKPAADTSRSPQRSTLGRLLRLTRKELRETLRDRRTVITLVLMPLLVYPLLSISFNKSLLLSSGRVTKPVFSIGFESQEDLDVLDSLLTEGGRLLDARKGESEDEGQHRQVQVGGRAVPMEVPSDEAPVELRWFGDKALENHVANLDVHVAVRIVYDDAGGRRQRRFSPIRCELIYRESSPTSTRVMRFIAERLQVVNQVSLQKRLLRMRAPAGVPAQVSFKSISSGSGAPFSLATLVPLVLILMTITGSVYPAIDLTAGERERGTLETLIAAPLSRLSLLVAKYAAVLIVAVLTAMVNLVAMTVTLLTSSLGTQLFPGGLSPVLMVEIFALMILFAAFFSAIVLAVTSVARSFKEAQAYLIPLMLLAISPGLLSLMPGLQLEGPLAIAPLVNIVLLSRDILEGTVQPPMALVAIFSTIVYAAAAIAIASRVFGNDALLYASRGSWSEMFQRPTTRRAAATPAVTLACLVTLFPCFFLLANLAQGTDLPLATQLHINAVVTTVVFGLWPLLFALVQRVTFRSAFQIHTAPWFAFIGAMVLGLTLWPFAYELFLLGEWAGLATLDKSQFAMAETLMKKFQGISPLVLLVTLAVIPAVMEEFFFRGFLFKGLRSRFPGAAIIAVTALLFGLFHVLSPSALMPERFLPSTMLGLVLGWVCYRSGSVIPGMLLHACHNGLLLLMVQHQNELESRGWDLQNSHHFPIAWLVGFGLVAAAAVATVYFSTRRFKSTR